MWADIGRREAIRVADSLYAAGYEVEVWRKEDLDKVIVAKVVSVGNLCPVYCRVGRKYI